MIGTVLGGRYTILEEVGKGGMAHVYKAQCNLLNRTVAIKVLRNDLEGGDEFIHRFNAEAQSAACLAHPNIVSIFDVGEENGLYYIVMEYIEGITLKEYIKSKGMLSSLESAEIASQICAALTVAHEKNIIHRDIKPHNIMVTTNNLIKVTDFGIARASNNATMQVGDSILGSVHYISPEQARGGYVDGRSDIYSLGIVLYEMLTGKLPFESESPIAIAMKHLEETPVAPKNLCPDVSDELQDIVLKAISKETRKRYQTVSAMKSDIDVIINLLKTANEAKIQGANVSETDDTPESNFIPQIDIVNGEENIPQNDIISDEYNMPQPDSDDSLVEAYDEETGEQEFDDYEDYDEPRGKLSFNMIFGAVIIALVVVGGASLVIGAFVAPDAPFFRIMSSFWGNSDVEVPDFVGMQYTEAKNKADSLDLVLEIGESEFGPEAKGIVTGQTVAKGYSVKKGKTITIYTSKGPDPDIFNTKHFEGKSYSVVDKYEEMGYNIKRIYKPDPEKKNDTILKVELKGNKITFYINSDEEEDMIRVPDLEGLSVSEARAKLEDAGLLLFEEDNYEYEKTDKVAPGKVASQSKSAGTLVEPKTEIRIILAKEPDEKDEPENDGDVKKTISVDVSGFESSTTIKFVAPSGATVYEKTVDPSKQKEVKVTLEGKGSVNYAVYINGSKYMDYKVDFNN